MEHLNENRRDEIDRRMQEILEEGVDSRLKWCIDVTDAEWGPAGAPPWQGQGEEQRKGH